MSAIRVCRWPRCRTHLSRFNPGDKCWAHTPDLTQDGAPRHVWLRQAPGLRGRMSDAFLDGIPEAYEITAAERAAWGEGRLTTDQLRSAVAGKSSAQRPRKV